jgi:radical SAM superfamily enzyme YgiQ (UPF0313 family)
MSKFKKASLIASGLLPINKPPPALAFLSSMCEVNQLSHELFDLNIHIKNSIGEDLWNRAYTIFASLDYIADKEVLDPVVESIDSAVDLIIAQSSDLILISVFSYQQIAIAKLFLTAFRKKANAIVVIGGPGVTYEMPSGVTAGKQMLDAGLTDYYVLGEGEHVLDQFLKGFLELGINYSGTSETWAVQIDNLDDCVFPTYKNINFDNYSPGIDLDHTISITCSRGCVRRCTFCDVGHLWKKFRFRSADNVISEMRKHINETGIKQFFFTDSLINGPLKQFTELVSQLALLRKTDPVFAGVSYVGQFIIRSQMHHKEEMYKLMHESGCQYIVIGIESGSEQVRDHMGKKFSNADIDYHLSMCSKYKIKNSLLMFTGYPTETLQDHNDTITMLRRYQKYLMDETVIALTLHQPFVLLKNTPISDMKHEIGIVNEQDNTYFFEVQSNPDFTVKEKFRRYLEVVKLSIDLKYPGSWADLASLRSHIHALTQFIDQGNKDTVSINQGVKT